MTTKTNGAVSAQEYEALQRNELSDEQVKKMFMSRFKFEYRTNGGYRPRNEAEYVKGRPYLGYFINYSFPPYSNKPVASVWTVQHENGEEKFKIFHLDLDKFTTTVIDELRKNGFNPPPSVKKPLTQQLEEEFSEDDKPY